MSRPEIPARGEIIHEVKKKVQFLNVLMDWEGELNLKKVEELFVQQRYADLPHPIRVSCGNHTPYDMQVLVVPEGSNLSGTSSSTLNSPRGQKYCACAQLEIDYCKQCREGGRALQYLLEAMGGFQVRC